MKPFVALVGLASVVLGIPPSLQQPELADSCRFTLSGDVAKPTITGPQDITPLVYVIEQPDSPVEIVSLDFTGYMLAVANERFTYKECSTIRIRNRSDQPVSNLEANAFLSTKGYVHGPSFVGSKGLIQSLGPGQETEIRSCGPSGTGDAPGNRVHIFASVEQLRINKCIYVPSKRIPYDLAENGI